jgi:predicted nucleotidyltransferase
MDFRRPLQVVTPTLDGDVLQALAHADIELSGRELARRVGRGSPEGIRRAADRLVKQGSVARRAAGGAHLYRLNRDHLAAPYVEGLATLRTQLIERLRESFASWGTQPRLALLFGSIARSDAGADSDLDVLVVRERACDPEDELWRTQLLELEQSATAWTGNDTRIVEFDEDELIEADPEPWLEDALRDGIELFGERRTLRRMLAAGGGS